MKLQENVIKELIRRAIEKRKDSYAPYSNFHVAAALLDKNGDIHTGVNVENASYGLCNCAERTAIFSAVEKGVREFEAICIVGAPKGEEIADYCPPCGACRQVMSEFCHKDFVVMLAKSEDDHKEFTLGELLPESFKI